MDLKLVEGKEIVNMYRTMVFNPLDGHDPLSNLFQVPITSNHIYLI